MKFAIFIFDSIRFGLKHLLLINYLLECRQFNQELFNIENVLIYINVTRAVFMWYVILFSEVYGMCTEVSTSNDNTQAVNSGALRVLRAPHEATRWITASHESDCFVLPR